MLFELTRKRSVTITLIDIPLIPLIDICLMRKTPNLQTVIKNEQFLLKFKSFEDLHTYNGTIYRFFTKAHYIFTLHIVFKMPIAVLATCVSDIKAHNLCATY